MRRLCLAFLFLTCLRLNAAEGCRTIHGRLHYYGGDGQLRIWHIGSHHEFEPDATTWDTVIQWLRDGVKRSEWRNYADPATGVDLFADFDVCPTQPFKKGSVQEAKVMSASHRHYVPNP
jgi:hypothetical protein